MKTGLQPLQWALFMLTGSIVTPVAIASLYGLSPADTVDFIQRTLFVLGVSGVLQTMLGHRLPIQEGPAGLWWGIFSLYAGLGPALFGSPHETLRVLQFAFLLSGVISIGLSLFGLVEKMARLFTPPVVGTYLILLVAQLSGSFLKGLSGLNEGSAVIRPVILILSVILLLLNYGLQRFPRVGPYAILITFVTGWLSFGALGLAKPFPAAEEWFRLPQPFAFGLPRFELNMVIPVILVTLLLLTNMLATIKVVQRVLEQQKEAYDPGRIKQAGVISGLNTILGGLFSAIGSVPISGSAGFISTTKITTRKPFLIGCLLIVAASLFPPVTSALSALPEAVGYAVVFPVFTGLIGLALLEFEGVQDRKHLFQTVGIALFTGMGVMFLPISAFEGMPSAVTSLLSNGLVLGTVIALGLDSLGRRKRSVFRSHREGN